MSPTTSSNTLRCWKVPSRAITLLSKPPTIANAIIGAEMAMTTTRVRELIRPQKCEGAEVRRCGGAEVRRCEHAPQEVQPHPHLRTLALSHLRTLAPSGVSVSQAIVKDRPADRRREARSAAPLVRRGI